MTRLATAIVLMLLTSTLIAHDAVAKSFEQPPGEPPFGVAVQSDAPGTKLSGQFAMGLVNVTLAGAGDVFVVLWLQKGSQAPQAFYTQISGVTNVLDPAVVQLAITDNLAPQILAFFFPGQSGLTVKLKSLTGFQQVFLGGACLFAFTNCFVNVADVTVAVQ